MNDLVNSPAFLLRLVRWFTACARDSPALASASESDLDFESDDLDLDADLDSDLESEPDFDSLVSASAESVELWTADTGPPERWVEADATVMIFAGTSFSLPSSWSICSLTVALKLSGSSGYHEHHPQRYEE
jgi:hypothetical protein